MGWLNKRDDDLPEQLRGKSPEDLLKLINANAELETKIKTFEDGQAVKDAELTDTRSQLQQVQQRLQEIDAARQSAASQASAAPAATPSVLDNEDAAFNARLAPLQIATMQNLAATARMQARDMILSADDFEARFFRKYQAEVEQLFNTMPIQHQTITGSYINCFNVVKGRHLKEVVDGAKKDDGASFTEAPSGGYPKPEGEKDTAPSEFDKIQAKKFGLDPQKYFEARKKLRVVA